MQTTYTLVPVGVAERDLKAEGLKRLGRLLLSSRGLLSRRRGGLRRGLGCLGLGLRLGLGVQRADLKLCLVLLEDALVVVLPELLGSVFTSNALEDLLTA